VNVVFGEAQAIITGISRTLYATNQASFSRKAQGACRSTLAQLYPFGEWAAPIHSAGGLLWEEFLDVREKPRQAKSSSLEN
jgi:hypothetical protein